MKQIANAFIQYTIENKGVMPGNGGGVNFHNSGNKAAGVFDWIAWHRRTDPITGAPNNNAEDLKITDSALSKYLSKSEETLEALYRCPSDNLLQRPQNAGDNNGGKGAYRYSYSANQFLTSKVGTPRKLSKVKDTASRVLLVCEDEKSIEDGYWNPNPYEWDTGRVNAVAARHQIRVKGARSTSDMNQRNEDARGNVAFADGHGEFIGRKDALRAKHSGHQYGQPAGTDPVGF
jgi:prepilin-type processing-associated H-X9-DG protein